MTIGRKEEMRTGLKEGMRIGLLRGKKFGPKEDIKRRMRRTTILHYKRTRIQVFHLKRCIILFLH